MAALVIILLLLAAALGVLGAILKAALVIALSLVLAVAFAIVGGYYWLRYRLRLYQREIDHEVGAREPGRERRVIEVPNEAAEPLGDRDGSPSPGAN